MTELTSKERFMRMYEHREADRVPIIEIFWDDTVERWHREGMPENISCAEYFGLDKKARIDIDNSPRFPVRMIEETDEYTISTTPWGATMKNWKHSTSTPGCIDFTITSREKWEEVKKSITPDKDRIDWRYLDENYKMWKEKGYWIEAGLWFGFDVTSSFMVAKDRFLCALIEDPEWCMDMFSHLLEVHIALFDMVWSAGYKFDVVRWPDDMGYKNKQFFSVDIYRNLLKPFHKRVIDWAHAKGLKAELHSCGNINPFVPELIEMGLDCLNPLEIKAGMDPIYLKKKYGDNLVFHGGINAMLLNQPDKIKSEMERVVPIMKEHGGYIFSSDHSVPSSVSLEDFRQIISLAKELGSY